MNTPVCELTRDGLDDFLNICSGLFCPLTGFMTSAACRRVISEMQLPEGSIWPLPVTLEVDEPTFRKAEQSDELAVTWQGRLVGGISVEDLFLVSPEEVLHAFGTTDRQHPGVKKELGRSPFRVGGNCVLEEAAWLEGRMQPNRIQSQFRERGWKTVAGFQTRNPVHRAHEYLLRLGLELCDGIFINPLVGWKKSGDFSECAVRAAYDKFLSDFLPTERTCFALLHTPMRYAGPREAIFHAVLRRNVGCSHFIIGRNHAGVGKYYSDYAAHDLARELAKKQSLGIELLLFREPYFCHRCAQIVTDRTCPHGSRAKVEISGTRIRERFAAGQVPEAVLMRPEISEAILKLGEDKFVP